MMLPRGRPLHVGSTVLLGIGRIPPNGRKTRQLLEHVLLARTHPTGYTNSVVLRQKGVLNRRENAKRFGKRPHPTLGF